MTDVWIRAGARANEALRRGLELKHKAHSGMGVQQRLRPEVAPKLTQNHPWQPCSGDLRTAAQEIGEARILPLEHNLGRLASPFSEPLHSRRGYRGRISRLSREDLRLKLPSEDTVTAEQ